jgi:hypothetical protein
VFLLLLLLIGVDSLPIANSEAKNARAPGGARASVAAPSPGPLISPITHQAISGPVDPNFAEYVYRRALLALGSGNKQRAVELLKFYAQAGSNPRQIARALQLIVEQEQGN